MAKFTRVFALMVFAVFAPRISSAWENVHLKPAEGTQGDPLASAPVIDYHMPPIEDPVVSPTPEIIYADDDIDFHGFKTRSQVIEFLKNCDKIADVDIDCGMDFHAAVFFTDVKPTNKCFRVVFPAFVMHLNFMEPAQAQMSKMLDFRAPFMFRCILRFGGFKEGRVINVTGSNMVHIRETVKQLDSK